MNVFKLIYHEMQVYKTSEISKSSKSSYINFYTIVVQINIFIGFKYMHFKEHRE